MKQTLRPEILETSRLRLRPLRASDALAIFGYASDPQVTKQVRFVTHRNLHDTRSFLRHVRQRRSKDCVWGIELKSARRVIGSIGLLDYAPEHHRAELGYALHREHWNRGIATEAVRAVINHAMRKLRINRLEAGTYLSNRASQRVLEKCGFKFEGVLRQRELIKGSYRDQRFYSLLRREL